MKVNLEAFEREFRKGRRLLLIITALVACFLVWTFASDARRGTSFSAEELRGFAVFFLAALGVYCIGLITRRIARKSANRP